MKFTQKFGIYPFSSLSSLSFSGTEWFCDTREQIPRYHWTDSARNSQVARFCFVALEEAMFDFFWGFNFVIIAKSGEDIFGQILAACMTAKNWE